jgi:UTP--glucose-1-phosphate uridylyltransferase
VEGLLRIESIIEKPGAERAPSDLASVSSYLFPPEFFDAVRTERVQLREGAELSLQAAMQRFLDDGHPLLALEIENARYHDSGNKLEYLKTVIQLGIEHPEIGDSLFDYLLETVKGHQAARDSAHD